jgi:hypothetical protein
MYGPPSEANDHTDALATTTESQAQEGAARLTPGSSLLRPQPSPENHTLAITSYVTRRLPPSRERNVKVAPRWVS